MADPLDIVVSENQRLKKEVRELQARVTAFESSRWWRLHPRFALSRFKHARRQSGPADARSAETPVPDDGLATRFRQEVVARGAFSEDWFTVHIPAWEPVMRRLEERESKILELGSFEGLSACFLLWRLGDAHVTCIDTFAGILGYRAYGIASSELEQTFDHNVELVDAGRVRKLVGETRRVLPDLVDEGQRFDLIYVDASHAALDVLVDVALSWQLLAPGGITIFDDYGPIPRGDDPLQHPTPAIDAFLGLLASQFEVLDRRRQLILQKRDGRCSAESD